MIKNIDLETFVYDILQKSNYVIVNQFDGIYEVRDDYTNHYNEGDQYALINVDDDADVIVLGDYLDRPGCKIKYDDAFGMPTFEIDAVQVVAIELSWHSCSLFVQIKKITLYILLKICYNSTRKEVSYG